MEETTYHGFSSQLRAFLSSLNRDPIGCKVSDYFKERGIGKGELIQACRTAGLLTKHEKIDDPDEEKGIKSPRYSVRYKIIGKGFEENMHNVYNSMKAKKHLNECEGAADAPASTNGASIAAIANNNAPVTKMNAKPIRRVIITESQAEYLKSVIGSKNAGDEELDEATVTTNVGSMGNYDVAFPIDKNDPTVKGRAVKTTQWH